MKSAAIFKSIIVCLLATMLVSPATAYWTDPVFLGELNDYNVGVPANRPSISSDENTIIYTLLSATGADWVWEARRNPDTGIFDQQRKLTELKYSGKYVYGYWMSQDNLRLYYAGHVSNGSSPRPIWFATRNNVNEPWQTIKRHTELELATMQAQCSLTADEKIIMYELVTTPRRIILASRDSIDEPFSNLQDVYELEAMEASGSFMRADGLAVFFIRRNSEGFNEVWGGYRNSLDEPFGDFMPLEDINQHAVATSGCSPSWDGQRMYVFQRWGEPSDLTAKGVFMYQWVDPPEVVAEKNMIEAIESKQFILEELAATIEMEIETLRILDMLQEPLDKHDRLYRAIHKTKNHIRKSLRDEFYAQMKIRRSIRELEKALSCYRMEEPGRPIQTRTGRPR